MKRSTQNLRASYLAACLLALFVSTIPANVEAAHKHDHIWLTITADLGYDSETGMTQVRAEATDGSQYLITLHGYLRHIESHVGRTGEARISVNQNGRWTHLAIEQHGGSVRIHRVRPL